MRIPLAHSPKWISSSPVRGGDYTKAIYPALINHGWQGYWIDAASAPRMDEKACIILDPSTAKISIVR